ncbi:N-6 DNA methylase, partial [Ferruginibacter sp.]|uniref:Eco57I restriction-modification methylase domain-containing protein n=1 Tax=Ferruginibacter sp. TaxID=1940288 RepID=UPI0019968EAF
KRLFFVEAKKPSVAVKDEIMPAYQIRRYAWSAKLPISILTDFEEFAIYDCNKKPNATDKPSVGRIKYLTFREYLKEFDFLWDTFSKGSVLRGSFDKFIAADKNKKGTTTVDKEFLTSLDEWRKQLALNIALRNEAHTEEELNFVVQQSLDRLIFLRIAEDRGVEEYGRLKTFVTSPKGGSPEGACYQNLFTYFKEADSKYNSGLFDFKKDSISHKTLVDNKTIKGIINELYYPISPYEFSVLSVEILGSAYEQFLGKQIKLTPGHRAVIEEKPEVRKAGGVYYTPQYIVEYIVENTVGKLAPMPPSPKGEKGITPAEVAKLKIVDPACGSGSFLLGAYQYLLNWHVEFFMPEFEKLTAIAQNSKDYTEKERNEAIKERNKLPLTPTGNLTTALKKQILLNNIYGVDIDTQAVEVTKLSLLLKCMEGETGSSINAEMRFGERVLPTLDSNIKSGNSLIDMDFYNGQIDFEPALEKKVKPFSWEQGFAAVFKQGGFDVVIGNPPYVKIQTMKEISKDSVNYYKFKYKSAEYGNYDLYVAFVEKGFSLLGKKGLLGFILPNKFFNTDYGRGLRGFINDEKALDKIVDFGSNQVFENATTYCCLLFLNTIEKNTFNYLKVNPDVLSAEHNFINLSKSEYSNDVWNFQGENENKILLKLNVQSVKLIDLPCEISRGSSTGNDSVFIVQENRDGTYTTAAGNIINLEKQVLRKPIFATNYTRYNLRKDTNEYLIFPYRLDNKASIIDELELKNLYPLAYSYLKSQKLKLEERAQYQQWYSYSAPRSLLLHSKADILIPLLADKGLFTELPFNKAQYTLMAGGGFSISIINENIDKHFLLGLLNSNLLFWVLKNISNVFRGGWITCTKQYFSQLPIKQIDFTNKSEKSLHDEIVQLVETMLQLQQQKQSSHLPNELQLLEQRIVYTDAAINKKVYALYGLTEDEVKLVEGV